LFIGLYFLHLAITFTLNVFWSEAKIHQHFNTFIALAYPGLLWCYMRYLEDRGKRIDILLAVFPAVLASIGYFSVAVYVINDHSRANAAFKSGAQIISTDFFRPGNGYNTTYYIQLPGGKPARPNPVNSKKTNK